MRGSRLYTFMTLTCPRDLQDDNNKVRLDSATDRALGPEGTRTRHMVHLEQYFEPVKEDTRCYNVASSLERQPTIIAPTAQLKDPREEGEVEGLSSDLTSVSGVAVIRSCPNLLFVRLSLRWR